MPKCFNYGTLSFGKENPFNFNDSTFKYGGDVRGLNVAVCGYGEEVKIGTGVVGAGRWSNIDESNIHKLFLNGYLPLDSITRIRRSPKDANPEFGGKDSRGKVKPDLRETTEKLKSLGVKFFDIPDFDINMYINGHRGPKHDFDPEVWSTLTNPGLESPWYDVVLIDVGTLDRKAALDDDGNQITHDAHLKFGDMMLQMWHRYNNSNSDPVRVLGIETPLCLDRGSARYLVDTANKQGNKLVAKGYVEFVHPTRHETSQTLKNSSIVPLYGEYHRTDTLPPAANRQLEAAFYKYNSETKGPPGPDKLCHDALNLITLCQTVLGVSLDDIEFGEINIRDLVPAGTYFDFAAHPYVTADGKSRATFDHINAEFTIRAGDRLLRVTQFEGGYISGEKRDSIITCHTGKGEPLHRFKENTLSTGQISLAPAEKIALGIPAGGDYTLYALRDVSGAAPKIISCSVKDAMKEYSPVEHILTHIAAQSLGFTDEELIPNDAVLKSLELLDRISQEAELSSAYVIKNFVPVPAPLVRAH